MHTNSDTPTKYKITFDSLCTIKRCLKQSGMLDILDSKNSELDDLWFNAALDTIRNAIINNGLFRHNPELDLSAVLLTTYTSNSFTRKLYRKITSNLKNVMIEGYNY